MEHPNLDFIKNLIETEYNAESDYSVTIDDETDPDDPRLYLYTYADENKIVEAEFKLYGGDDCGLLLVCCLHNVKDEENAPRYVLKTDLLQNALLLVNKANFEFASMIGRLSLKICEEGIVPHSMAYFKIQSEPCPETIRPMIRNIMENHLFYELAVPLSIIIDEIEETYKQPWVSSEEEDGQGTEFQN